MAGEPASGPSPLVKTMIALLIAGAGIGVGIGIGAGIWKSDSAPASASAAATNATSGASAWLFVVSAESCTIKAAPSGNDLEITLRGVPQGEFCNGL